MDEKKIEAMYEAVMENNRMLKSARRTAMVGGIIKFIFWIFLLLILPYLTWLYLQPYLDTIMGQYQTLQNQSGVVSTQAADLQEQLNSFGSFDLREIYDKYFAPKAE